MEHARIIETSTETEHGWWTLQTEGPHKHRVYRSKISLPAFMLPYDLRRGDRVTVERVWGRLGYWRVVRTLRSHYGRRHLRS